MDDRIVCHFDLCAPIDVVFNFVTDPGNMTLFQGAGKIPGVVRRAETPRFVGQVENIYSVDGSVHEEEVIELDPPNLMKLHIRKIGIPVSIFLEQVYDTFKFEAIEANKTRIHRLMEIYFRKNVIAEMLGRRLLMGNLRKSVDEHHERIRERLEVGIRP